ncbi:hypothetical protein ACQ4WX_48945 [Streptomyces lasalocidi]
MILSLVRDIMDVPAASWDALAEHAGFYLSHQWLAAQQHDPTAEVHYALVHDDGRLRRRGTAVRGQDRTQRPLPRPRTPPRPHTGQNPPRRSPPRLPQRPAPPPRPGPWPAASSA